MTKLFIRAAMALESELVCSNPGRILIHSAGGDVQGLESLLTQEVVLAAAAATAAAEEATAAVEARLCCCVVCGHPGWDNITVHLPIGKIILTLTVLSNGTNCTLTLHHARSVCQQSCSVSRVCH